MLTPSKLQAVEALTAGWNKEELVWLHGYVAGLLANETKEDSAPVQGLRKITITYGTETGNAKRLAAGFAARAKKRGIVAKLVGLDQYRVSDLQKEEYFLTIVSTQGEGDPPATAQNFYAHIHSNGFRLPGVKYGVLALGDTAYPLFCKAGEDVDLQLNKLGAERLVPLQKCDTDYELEAADWFARVLEQLGDQKPAATVKDQPAKKSTGRKTYRGTVLSSVNLNDQGSAKQTYHLEIGAEGLEYLPGDALGVVPYNAPASVQEAIRLIGVPEDRPVSFRNETHSFAALLQQKLNIAYLPERVVARYAALVRQGIPATRMSLLDLLKIYPLDHAEQLPQLLDLLEPITPRLYSIASSPEAHPGEVHLTVAKEQFSCGDDWKQGLCSGYLSSLEEGVSFDFYIHKNERFRLPAPESDVIMIGPGTGVAPFRSFLAHRDATGAAGRNWLFFGAQHFVSDFLYQSEMQNWLDLGVLTRMDVAFSRDQPEKIYVQDKIRKQGAALYEWMSSGATLYVCGNKDPMSRDVENTLARVIEEQGKKTETQALELIAQWQEEGRYLKDVY